MMHNEVISEELKHVINKVFESSGFDHFNLGGGTALALQLGHRISIDADFICAKDFDKEAILKLVLDTFPGANDIHTGTFGVFLKVGNVKLDFLSWGIPFIRPAVEIRNWRLLNIGDIAAMKCFAILQRGEKKDYIDIAAILKEYHLGQILSFYKERHSGSDVATIIRFLSSYSDIEQQPLPTMMDHTTWDEAKQVIQHSITEFMK